MNDDEEFEVPPVLPEGVDINDNDAVMAALPRLDMAEFDREEAAFRVDEITKARFLTLIEGKCPRCEAVITREELMPDGVANARIEHAEPCIAGQAGETELGELVEKHNFPMGYIYAIKQHDGRRVMYLALARLELPPQGEQFR